MSTAQAQQPAITSVVARDLALSSLQKGYDSLSTQARNLVDRAIRLTDDVDDMPCDGRYTRRIYDEATEVLSELKKLENLAVFAGFGDAAALVDYVADDLDDALYWYEEDCGPPGGLRLGPLVSFGLSGGPSRINLPSQAYLGINNGVSDVLNLYKTPRYATGESFSGYIKFDTTQYFSPVFNFSGRGTTSTWVKATGFYSTARLEDHPGTISPGAGNRMLFPGPTGGASGVSLGGFPANIVTNGNYVSNFNKIGGRFDIGQSTHFPISVSVDLYGGAAAGHTNYSQNFTGAVPGFGRMFAYTTDTDVDWAKLRGGVRISKEFDLSRGFSLNLGAGFEVGPDFSSASGTDQFSFTGVQSSSANLSASRTALGYSAQLSATLKLPDDFSIGLAAIYTRETGLPVVTRDGTNQSQLSLEDGDKNDFRFFASKAFK